MVCVDENLPMQNVFSGEHFFHEFAANYFTLSPRRACCTVCVYTSTRPAVSYCPHAIHRIVSLSSHSIKSLLAHFIHMGELRTDIYGRKEAGGTG